MKSDEGFSNMLDKTILIDCDIITMPAGIIEKVSKFGKSFQSLTVDTVKKFLIDSEESNFKL